MIVFVDDLVNYDLLLTLVTCRLVSVLIDIVLIDRKNKRLQKPQNWP